MSLKGKSGRVIGGRDFNQTIGGVCGCNVWVPIVEKVAY